MRLSYSHKGEEFMFYLSVVCKFYLGIRQIFAGIVHRHL